MQLIYILEVGLIGGAQGRHEGPEGEAEEEGLSQARALGGWVEGPFAEMKAERDESWLRMCEVRDGREALRMGLEAQKRGLSQRHKRRGGGPDGGSVSGGASGSLLPLQCVGTGGQTITYTLREGKGWRSLSKNRVVPPVLTNPFSA